MKQSIRICAITMGALAMAGCFNNTSYTDIHGGGGATHEHVLVHYMETTPTGASGNGHDGSPMRHLTISDSYVWFENYDGYSKLIPMERVRTLNWRPNPDPPREDQEDQED